MRKFHTSAGMEPTPECLPGERLDYYATEVLAQVSSARHTRSDGLTDQVVTDLGLSDRFNVCGGKISRRRSVKQSECERRA
jgi:hypothetical protein